MAKRTRPRCAACKKRIKPSEPNYGVENLDSVKEKLYHVALPCAKHAFAEKMRGTAIVIHHYHAPSCGDEENGFTCAGECFLYDTEELAELYS